MCKGNLKIKRNININLKNHPSLVFLPFIKYVCRRIANQSFKDMIKKFVLTVMALLAFATVHAQHDSDAKTASRDVKITSTDTAPALTGEMQPSAYSQDYDKSVLHDALIVNSLNDSLHLPLLDACGQVAPIGLYPSYFYGWNNWQLHKGLNINLGASVFARFGKNTNHGAGFTQNLSAMYALPVTNKLSVAVGGYLNNIFWMHDNYKDAGLSAVIGYRFNERWEAYLYGQKSLVDNKRMPYSLYDMNNVGDRIGAAVKYNFNNNASIQISVETTSMPKTKSPLFIEPPAFQP